jgi:hypothetical protein
VVAYKVNSPLEMAKYDEQLFFGKKNKQKTKNQTKLKTIDSVSTCIMILDYTVNFGKDRRIVVHNDNHD